MDEKPKLERRETVDLRDRQRQRRNAKRFFAKAVSHFEGKASQFETMATNILNSTTDPKAEEVALSADGFAGRNYYKEFANLYSLLKLVVLEQIDYRERIKVDEMLLFSFLKHYRSGDQKRLQETLSKVKVVQAELKSRKKGLDWVDNLINHTPSTEQN